MVLSSGIGTYLRNLIPRLAKQCDLTVLGDPAKLKSLHKDLKVIPFTAPIYSLKEQYYYPKIIPKCDIFWSPHFNVPWLPIKAKKRVVTIHDVFHLAFYNTLSYAQKAYARFTLTKAVKVSSCIITDSFFSKSEIEKFFPKSSTAINVIYLGIDTLLFNQSSDPATTKKTKKKFNLPPSFFLTVGNLKPHKNTLMVVRAFEQFMFTPQYQGQKLVIVGKRSGFLTQDNALKSYLEKKPSIQNNLIFTGYVEDNELADIYRLADLFIFPSLYEGFGFPPLEALSCGCPVIASKAASIPEILGNRASYFDPSDLNSLTQALCNSPEYNRLSSLDLKKFCWDKSAHKHLQLLKQITPTLLYESCH